MNRKHIFSLLAATLLTATVSLLTACGSDDDDTTVPHITPEATGEFTDNRDGTTYHYVTYGGLDWTVENARYDTGNDDTRSIYLSNDAIGDEEGTAAQQTVGTYGYLYSWQGAQEAVPDGWRLPTDDDWKKLEMALGMTQQQADADGWRGTVQKMVPASTCAMADSWTGCLLPSPRNITFSKPWDTTGQQHLVTT